MSDSVVKCLEYINDMSNIVKNAGVVRSRREVDVPIDWMGEKKQRVPPRKFKVSY